MGKSRTAVLDIDADLEAQVDDEFVEEIAPPRRRGRLQAATPATRDDLVDYVAKDCECSKTVARAVVDSTCRGMVALTCERGVLRVPKLGTFRVMSVQPRAGRNPRTGEPVPIRAGRRAIFRASKQFKDLINGVITRR